MSSIQNAILAAIKHSRDTDSIARVILSDHPGATMAEAMECVRVEAGIRNEGFDSREVIVDLNGIERDARDVWGWDQDTEDGEQNWRIEIVGAALADQGGAA